MSDIVSPPSQNPVCRRPLWEKMIVWGGILVLLGVLLLEWRMREGYSATLKDLEETFNRSQSIAIAELPQHIHGFAFRTEGKKANTRVIELTWTSLFKQYKLGLPVSQAETLTTVDPADEFVQQIAESRDIKQTTVEPPKVDPAVTEVAQNASVPQSPPQADQPSTKPSPTEPQPTVQTTAPAPLRFGDQTFSGKLPEGYEGIAAIRWEEKRGRNDARGWLTRELIRQAVLIAAEEELGLTTLDPSIGEAIPVGDGPNGPLIVHFAGTNPDTSRHVDNRILRLYRFTITLHHDSPKGYRRWQAPEWDLPIGYSLESLVKDVEASSRKEFVDGLTSIGFEKASKKDVTESPDIPENHLDFVSQYALVRALHSQLRSQEETPEVVGRLVCAYANLGNLIDFHWSPAAKAYKARSMIYAQRLVSKYGSTQFALAHQAYAQALAGRHGVALETAKSAKAATGPDAPEWLDLIEAYCAYEPQTIEVVKGRYTELSDYLNMRMADLTGDPEGSLEAISRMLQSNRSCTRAVESMSEMQELGVRRTAVEGAAMQQWSEIYRQLARIPNLPIEVKNVMMDYAKARRPGNDIAMRAQLIAKLNQSTGVKNHSGPSWSALGSLVWDTSHVHIWRLLELESNALAVSRDSTLELFRPLFVGHRHEKWLESFCDDRAKGLKSFVDYQKDLFLDDINVNMLPVQQKFTAALQIPNANTFSTRLRDNIDPIFEDSMRQVMGHQLPLFALDSISPRWPMGIVAKIATEVMPQVQRWEASHGDSPAILMALAKQYYLVGEKEASQRCAEKLIGIKPSHMAYKILAVIDKEKGDRAKWRETLERSLELPSRGLESARTHCDLAEDSCDQGDWEAARPHALAAAESYSEWGLKSAVRALEGLEEWELAEQYVRACSERYDVSCGSWYFWCYRTGHGDIEKAKEFAKLQWNSPTFSKSNRKDVVADSLIDGDLVAARQSLQGGYKTDTSFTALTAILADEEGLVDVRDQAFRDIEPTAKLEYGFAELTNLCRGVLSDKEECRWNKNAFNLLVISENPYFTPHLYMAAGRFLANHGQLELADEYLNTAANYPERDWVSTIAIATLRKHNLTIRPHSKQRLPEPLNTVYPFVVQFKKAFGNGQFDEAERVAAKALELRSDYVPALVMRGTARECKEQYAEALADFEQALQLDPNYPHAHLKLAWLLATCPKDELRDGKRALAHAETALRLRQFEASINAATLAVAYAECGDFEKAIESHNRSGRLHAGLNWRVDPINSYKENKPHRLTFFASTRSTWKQ
ncbi:MAG: hypothetical protein JWP89_3562 [Schlesneria sp.]|nr:hypothetical protein [Schlesneria sp.]